tara:strand:- start:372 stop:1355 length:984 start_codon:yes stop_codon:yes gene_type:complete
MEQPAKPFLSKNNPLNMSIDDGEKFSLNYLLPTYWFTWLIIFFSFILSHSPNFLRSFLGILVGNTIYHFNNKRRNISKKNLSLCFKKMSSQDLNNLSKAYFLYLGKTFMDLPLLWWRSNLSLQSRCQIINSEYIDNELSKNKGVILLTAHTVSLDFGGRSLSKYPIISMYKPFRNKLLNWFIGKSRSKITDNVVVFPRDNFSFKKIIRALKSQNIFYYVADEDLGKDNSVFEYFFDEPKSTLISISKIASLSKASVLPCINHYCPITKKYITFIDKPISDFSENDMKKNAKLINRALEKNIKRDLEQYMWSLRLFQTRPDDRKYPYE